MTKSFLILIAFLAPAFVSAKVKPPETVLNIVSTFDSGSPHAYLISEDPPATAYLYCDAFGYLRGTLSLGSPKVFRLMGLTYRSPERISKRDCDAIVRNIAAFASPSRPIPLVFAEDGVHFPELNQ